MIRINSDSRVLRRAAGLVGVGVAALSLVLLTPSPALADSDVSVDVTRPLVLRGAGDAGSLVIVVENDGPDDAPVDVFFPVPLAAQGVQLVDLSPAECFFQGEVICEFDMDEGDTERILATFRAPENVARAVNQTTAVVAQNLDGEDLDTGDNFERYTATLGDVGAAAPAPPPPPPAPAPPPNAGEVSGTVVDRASNAPLRGATVQLADAKGAKSQVKADAAGRFLWRPVNGPSLRAGTVTLTASTTGYQPAKTAVEVAPGGKVGNVRLALAEQPAPSPSASAQQGEGGGSPSDATARNRATERFDLVSGVLAGSIGLGVLVALGGIIWMWHGLGPGARRDAADLLPAGHRRRWFGRRRV